MKRIGVLMAVVVVAVPASSSFGQAAQPLIAFEQTVGGGAASISVMPVDGVNPRKLTPGHGFEWSPDGTRLAYFTPTQAVDVADLWVISRDRSGLKRLVRQGAIDPPRYPSDFRITWSPDGRQIAFTGPGPTVKSFSSIYVVNSDGTGLARLTTPRGNAEDHAPDWSPDGTAIAFVREDAKHGYHLFVMKPDGTSTRELAKALEYPDEPAWSPNGAMLAFAGTDYEGAGYDNPDVFVVNRDGSGLRNLTHSRVFPDSRPRWSPDGRRIVFVSNKHHNRPDIHLIGSDGTKHVTVAKSPNYDAEPEWSPDGRSIVFASTRDGNRDIYVVSATGRNLKNLTNGSIGTRNSAPAYSP